MTVKKGDTLFSTENGEPVQVERMVKGRAGTYRVGRINVTMSNGDRFYLVTEQGSPLPTRYTLTQTPELARLWARELRKRETERAEREAERERQRLVRIANRDRLNAPPSVTAPVVVGDEVRVSITTAETDRRTGEVEDHTSEVRASVYAYPDYLISEDGEHTHRMTHGVNWSALGTQSPAVARAYAHAILAAADLADARNAAPVWCAGCATDAITATDGECDTCGQPVTPTPTEN